MFPLKRHDTEEDTKKEKKQADNTKPAPTEVKNLDDEERKQSQRARFQSAERTGREGDFNDVPVQSAEERLPRNPTLPG